MHGVFFPGHSPAVRGEDRVNHTELPQIPPWSGTLCMQRNRSRIGGHFTLSRRGRHGREGRGEMRSSTPGYVVLDADLSTATIACAGASFTLRAGVRNILDRDVPAAPLDAAWSGAIRTRP